jgi:transposase
MKILGIDMGWSKSVCCLLDTDTGEVSYQTLLTCKEAFASHLQQVSCDLLVIEAGPMAGWVKDLCDSKGVKLRVVNTSDEPWQWRNVKKKTDRRDAHKLCTLTAMNQGSAVHVPGHDVRQWRQLIFYRDTLVCEMTAIKNRVRALLLQEDLHLPDGARAFAGPERHKLVELAKELSDCTKDELWRGMVKLELARLDQLMEQVQAVESKLNAISRDDHRVARLQQTPGVGPRTAELVVAMIDDPKRFGRGRQVSSYAGLVPKKFSSGKIDRDGRISRCGNGLLRKFLVQASWIGKRTDPRMAEIYRRSVRNSPKRKKQAIVAVARHLLVWLWAMLRDESDWRGGAVLIQPRRHRGASLTPEAAA